MNSGILKNNTEMDGKNMISRESLRIRSRKGRKIMDTWHANPTRRDIGFRGTTPKNCSCSVCGNPRKHYGNSMHAKSMQELRNLQDEE